MLWNALKRLALLFRSQPLPLASVTQSRNRWKLKLVVLDGCFARASPLIADARRLAALLSFMALSLSVAPAALAKGVRTGDWRRSHVSASPALPAPPLPPARPSDLTPPVDRSLGPPLPPPRPADLAQPPAPAPSTAPAPNPQASAQCDQLLAAGTIVGERRPAIADSAECAIDAPVSVEAVILKEGRRVALAPPALVNCVMAGALAEWLREEGAEILEEQRGPLKRLIVGGGYQCRRRNGAETGKISEHAHGNALDLIGVEWVRGDKMTFTDPALDLALATDLQLSLCGRFSTVLGPGSDAFHDSHVHIDLDQRAHGFKLCEWDLQ